MGDDLASVDLDSIARFSNWTDLPTKTTHSRADRHWNRSRFVVGYQESRLALCDSCVKLFGGHIFFAQQ